MAGADHDASGDLERAIRSLLQGREGTICPSEAARRVADRRGGSWRDLMEPARRAAQRLVEAGEVEVTQQGQVVDLATARGPIRIRLLQRGPRATDPT